MKKLIFSVLSCGVVSLFVSVGGAQAADANSSVQAHLGEGGMPSASDSWSAPQGAQGPIRSDMSTARAADPNDAIQAQLGGDGRGIYAQMNSDKGATWSAPSGPQGPIRNDFIDDKMLYPLSAGG